MNQLVQQGQKLLGKVQLTRKAPKKLFTYDEELNAWVRIEAHLNEHQMTMEDDECVVSEKDQSSLWFSW